MRRVIHLTIKEHMINEFKLIALTMFIILIIQASEDQCSIDWYSVVTLVLAVLIGSFGRVLHHYKLFKREELVINDELVYFKGKQAELKYTYFPLIVNNIRITSYSWQTYSRVRVTPSMVSKRDWNLLLEKCRK